MGRVQETGGNLQFFHSVGEDNTIYLKGGYGTIDGTNVEDNTHLYGTAAFAHLLDMPGYEYFTIGFALSYEQFDNNQNHFTYGNGGYFSPQYLLQGIVQAQFLTEEGKRWLAAGSVGAGVQNNTRMLHRISRSMMTARSLIRRSPPLASASSSSRAAISSTPTG